MSSVYANYSREDLIREIEILKAQGTSVNDEKIYQSRFLNNAVALRKTFSEVLSLLITPSQKDIIDQSLLTYNRQNEKYEFSKRKVQEETFEYSLNEVRTSLFHSVILYPFERSHIEFKQDIFTTFN